MSFIDRLLNRKPKDEMQKEPVRLDPERLERMGRMFGEYDRGNLSLLLGDLATYEKLKQTGDRTLAEHLEAKFANPSYVESTLKPGRTDLDSMAADEQGRAYLGEGDAPGSAAAIKALSDELFSRYERSGR